MDQEYYKEYYDLERKNWWFIVRSQILRQKVKQHAGKQRNLKILNIGVATGATSEMLSEFGYVSSIEFDEFCFQFTKGILGDSLQQGSILDLKFENYSFDLVCAFDVIEHVEDDQLAVSEMKRVSKNNGIVFITVPAFMSLWGVHDEINHHFRRYKTKQLKSLLENGENGKLIYTSYFNTLLFFPAWVFRNLNNFLKPILPKRKGSGSDHNVIPSNGLINSTLKFVFALEKPFLNSGISLPFGVSAMILWRKSKV